MMKKLMLSILPILLLFSIGFSTWSYGPNLIQNGDFANTSIVNASFPSDWFPTDYSDANCTGFTNNVQWNSSLFQFDSTGHYLNITFISAGWTEDVLTSPFYFDNEKQYLLSIDFKPLSDAYGINDANFSWLGTFRSDAEVCSAEGWGLFRWWNTTHAFYTTDVQVFVDAQITSLGGGWYRYQEVFTPSQPDGANMVMTINGDGAFVKYGIDNVKIMELTYQCEGWECNTLAKGFILTMLSMIPLFVAISVIILTRPESIMVMVGELVIAGVMTIVLMGVISGIA